MLRATAGFLSLLVFRLAVSHEARAEEPIQGTWKRGDGKAIVEIAPCGSDLCAVNTWVAPTAKDEKTGDKLVMRLKRQDVARYKGTAHDPQRGLTYSMTVKTSDTSMLSQGCVLAGLVFRLRHLLARQAGLRANVGDIRNTSKFMSLVQLMHLTLGSIT